MCREEVEKIYKIAYDNMQNEEPSSITPVGIGAIGGGAIGASSAFRSIAPKYNGMSKRKGDKVQKGIDNEISSLKGGLAKDIDSVKSNINLDSAAKRSQIDNLKQSTKTEIGNLKKTSPKNSFGSRLKTFGKSFGTGGVGKTLFRSGIGAGAGALIGAGYHALDSYANRSKTASEIIYELYKEASLIKCQHCGYEGETTYDGRCPSCGLVLGRYEPEAPAGEEHRNTVESSLKDQTVDSLAEQARIEDWSF